ncbi:MAG: hypothetical protein HC767_00990 [Akkermansiaceae bacterium]|nr:hypothetical protein [Akkermansiaceae bacterium]
MSKNSIGDQGAAAIGTLLMNNNLTYVSISHCCIRTCGAQWIADFLPRSQVCNTAQQANPKHLAPMSAA